MSRTTAAALQPPIVAAPTRLAEQGRRTGNPFGARGRKLTDRADEFLEQAEWQIEAERGNYCPDYFARDRANMIRRRAQFLSIRAVSAEWRDWARSVRQEIR